MRGARVLEAGCGVGLPGALALQLGCAELVLQDYNAAVLCWMTMRMPHRVPTPYEEPRARASRPGSNPGLAGLLLTRSGLALHSHAPP